MGPDYCSVQCLFSLLFFFLFFLFSSSFSFCYLALFLCDFLFVFFASLLRSSSDGNRPSNYRYLNIRYWLNSFRENYVHKRRHMFSRLVLKPFDGR